jgi:hypothetical protein
VAPRTKAMVAAASLLPPVTDSKAASVPASSGFAVAAQVAARKTGGFFCCYAREVSIQP